MQSDFTRGRGLHKDCHCPQQPFASPALFRLHLMSLLPKESEMIYTTHLMIREAYLWLIFWYKDLGKRRSSS